MKTKTHNKPLAAQLVTRAGVVCALRSLGFCMNEKDTPPALRGVKSAAVYTPAEMDFAKYLRDDTDFGGAWDDAEQIEMHTV